MAKIPGVGELHEGILEREPLHEGYQLRITSPDGKQTTLLMEEVLAEYVGRQVRFTIAFVDTLEAATNQTRTDQVESVSLSDIKKGN